jgi:hypothetical protein
MSLKKMKRALVMELGAKSNMNLFQKAKSHHKALADHETAMSVLAHPHICRSGYKHSPVRHFNGFGNAY